MRRTLLILTVGMLATALSTGAAGEDAAAAPPISCANGLVGGVNCIATKQDLKKAQEAFRRGMKLNEHQQTEEAFVQFDDAARLNPHDMEYLTAREVVKAKLVFDHIHRGDELLSNHERLPAAAEFRAALALNPDDQYAEERLQEAGYDLELARRSAVKVRLADSQELHLEPPDERATFHFSGDARSLFTQLGAAYRMTIQVDELVKPIQVRFNVDSVDFFSALRLACLVSKTMWVALDAHQVLIVGDNPDNHQRYDRMSLMKFPLPEHATPQETTEVLNLIRSVFEVRFVSSGQTSNTVEVRASPGILEACSKMIQELNNPRPQVMLDVRVYQINHQLTRNIGLHIPDTFNLYNIPAVALAGLAGQSIQQLINQLIASGGINQAGSTSLAGLLAQLTGQQSSIFSQPLATFGGGLTFEGLSLDQLAANLSLNESWVRSLDDVSMRAGQGMDATFHLGSRYPILNASYSPIYNSPQISQVLGNQTYVPPVPSVSYEDLGLIIKAKPTIHGDGTVSLQLEMQVRSLTGQADNGVPVISNREYKGSIHLNDGESAFVAGEVSQTDTRSMSGIPGLGFVPGLNMAMVNNTKQENDDELLIAITPHVVSNFDRNTSEIWISQN